MTSKLKGRNGFRALLFLPYVLHSVAIVIMFKNVYHVEYGSLNLFLNAIGLGSWQQAWLGNPNLVNFSLAFISVWKYFGLSMVIFIGALQSIPADLYEAAKIDGASGWQCSGRGNKRWNAQAVDGRPLPLVAASRLRRLLPDLLGRYRSF